MEKISALFFFFLLVSGSAATAPGRRRLVFYFSDVLCDEKNVNRTILTGENHSGNMVAFYDRVNLDNNLQSTLSTTVRRAQNSSFYGNRDRFTAWLGFSVVFNYNNHTGGSFNFFGADPLMGNANDVSVIGGTGDFFVGRGRAILMISSFQGNLYFSLHIDFNLYDS